MSFDDTLKERRVRYNNGKSTSATLQFIGELINEHGSSEEITDILKERGDNYGKFVDHSRISQSMNTMIRMGKSWNDMRVDQKEALEMIVHKMARILNGDPNYKDSWVDIEGYARLISDTLKDNDV